jgi:predicted nucleic acid-binding protein
MSDRFFLDSNIFVYAFDRSVPAKSQRAEKLIREALSTQKGVVSYQVVQEFFNIALRRFSPPMNILEAEQYLNSVFRPLLRVHWSTALYLESLQLHVAGHISWYDSLIVAAALEARCDLLLTEDFQHGQRFGSLRIANPFV